MQTEGIKYAGSKKLIVPNIILIAQKLGAKSAFDGFSGSTRVSQALFKAGFCVHANDIADWSYVFGLCYLKNDRPPEHYQPILNHLNNLKGTDGWFTQNYGGTQNDEKKIWQIHNTQKLDAIRTEIDRLNLSEIERSVLLTSLILAMDKVDSTLGHQASYLRQWAPRSFQTMQMTLPKILSTKRTLNRVTQDDVFSATKDLNVDLAYFDPPYGSSNEKMPPSRVRYASYYHLWATICRNDQPKLVGAALRREDVSDTKTGSVFEEFRKGPNGRYLALEAIEKMLIQTKCPHIILSYSNQGRATHQQLLELISANSHDFRIVEQNHKSHVMRSMRWSKEWAQLNSETKEYLFVISKSDKLNLIDTI